MRRRGSTRVRDSEPKAPRYQTSGLFCGHSDDRQADCTSGQIGELCSKCRGRLRPRCAAKGGARPASKDVPPQRRFWRSLVTPLGV